MELRDKFYRWYKLVQKEKAVQIFEPIPCRGIFSIEEEKELAELNTYINKASDYFLVNYQSFVTSFLEYFNGAKKEWSVDYFKRINIDEEDEIFDESKKYEYEIYITQKGNNVNLFLYSVVSNKEIDDQILCNKKTNLSLDVLKLLMGTCSDLAICNADKTEGKLLRAGKDYKELQDVIWNIVKRNQVLKLQHKLKEKNKIQKIQERKVAKTAREIESIESQLIEMGESLRN